jgi:hypothetical protein
MADAGKTPHIRESAKQKLIGGRAHYQRCSSPPQERDALIVDGETMHDHSVFIQYIEALEFRKLCPRFSIDSFTCVHNKGACFGSSGTRRPKIAAECQ